MPKSASEVMAEKTSPIPAAESTPNHTLQNRPNGHEAEQRDGEVEAQKSAPIDAPPNGGYGWVCVICVALINCHSWGLNSSYGVFLAYFIRNNTFPEASYLDYAFVGGLSVSVALLLAPLATLSIRALGTRITLLFGVGFETLALISASFATQIWHLFLAQGVCFGLGLGFLFIASVGIVPQWFTTKRSFANACAAAGSGLGGLIYNLSSQAVINEYDWRWGYRMVGICAFVVNLICTLLVKDRNKAVGAQFDLFAHQMFKRKEFIMLEAWGFFNMFGYLVLIYSLPNYASSIGLTPSQGSIIGAILNLGQAVGRPIVGLISDRVGRINIATVTSALCGVLCLVWWTFADSFGALVSFALIIGLIAGTYWGTIAPVGAEVVGIRDLPSALSLTWLCLVLPVTFSEAIALEIESNTKYLYAQIYTGLVYILSAACLWYVRAWKIGQLEELAAAEGKDSSEVSAVQPENPAESGQDLTPYNKSNVVKRLVMWKRV